MNGPGDIEQQIRPFEVTHRLVLGIAVPMTLGLLTAPLLGLTGTAVVGHLGSAEALAGLAVASIIFDLLYGSLSFLRVSTTGLVAQAFGRDDQREQQAIFFRALFSAFGLGLVIFALSPFVAAFVPNILTGDPAVAEVARRYFAIRVLASPVTFGNMAVFGYLFGRGQAMTGLVLQILINGTNIVLAILFGVQFGWGVEGVAWATVFAEAIGVIIGIVIVLRQFSRAYRPSRSEILDTGKLKQLFQMNADILIRSLVLNGSVAIMTRIGAGFGAVTLAANAVLFNIFMLSAFFLDGLAGAAEQLSGRAVGARFRSAFDRMLRLTGLWSFAMAALLGLFFALFGNAVINLLTTSDEVRQAALTYLPWAALTGITGALAFQMDGVFIGATWSREMRNMMLASCLVYCISLYPLTTLFGNHGLWMALNLLLLARGLFLAVMLPRKARQSFAAAQ
jgi:putative MATE family efflux protein